MRLGLSRTLNLDRAWLRESLSLVTGEGLRGEVKDLAQLIKRHEEYHTQIERQLDKSEVMKNEGRHLIQEGNFMSEEVHLLYSKNYRVPC